MIGNGGDCNLNTKVLIVDDEESIQELVSYNLEHAGYTVIQAFDGIEAFEKIKDEKPDLILLDIMLPHVDGLEICRQVRSKSTVPIIMLTARSTETDKVIGLEYGADDYITKPFSPRELLARVNALLRRTNQTFSDQKFLEFGDLIIDPDKRKVTINDVLIELTFKEFELLLLLAKNPGRIFTREQLLEKIWRIDNYFDTRTVDVHIRYLRSKIEKDPSKPKHLQTIRGVGYKFEGKQDA